MQRVRRAYFALLLLASMAAVSSVGCTPGAPDDAPSPDTTAARDGERSPHAAATPLPTDAGPAATRRDAEAPSDRPEATAPHDVAGTDPPIERTAPGPSRLPAVGPLHADEPTESGLPEIVLSQAHAETALLGVGDAFPEISLPDLEGQLRSLAELRADRPAVVFFWSSDNLYARMELEQIERDVTELFGEQVALVAVNVRDEANVAAQAAAEAEASFPQLLDPDHQLYGLVATARLPRTYVLDSVGTIRWYDIDWSRSTRRQLRQALRYLLTPAASTAGTP